MSTRNPDTLPNPPLVKTSNGWALADALEFIIMAQAENPLMPDWKWIGAHVGLPYQTCAALARVHERHR